MNYELLSKIYYKNNSDYDDIFNKRINSCSTCHYAFNIGGYESFLVINSEILSLITEILKQDKRLLRIAKTVPGIALAQFTKKCLIDEIKLTNELEGVYSTRHEINQIINDIDSKKETSKKKQRLHGLIQKYNMLMQREEIPMYSCQDIRTIYNDLILAEIKHDDPKDIPDGRIFRKEGVEVLSVSGKAIHKGLMPEQKIIEYMTEALTILNGKENALINIAIFHYAFGYIHPFYDGNGRTSRFVSSYMLSKQLEPIIAFGLSYTIKQNVNKYYDSFKYTNDKKNRGELTGFVIDFLEIVKQSIVNLCEALEARHEKLFFYSEKAKRLAVGDKNSPKILFVLVQNSLFAEQGLSVNELAEICELSTTTIRICIGSLPPNIFRIEVAGNKKLYDIDLDVLGEVD